MKKQIYAYRKIGRQLAAVAIATIGFSTTQGVLADTWQANSPDQIVIAEGATEYTLKRGDTLWAVSVAIDIPVETLAELSSVDLASGQQYSLPVGYVIRWNQAKTKLELTNPDGEVVNSLVKNADGIYEPVSINQTVGEPVKIEALAEKIDVVKSVDGLTHIKVKDGENTQEVLNELKQFLDENLLEEESSFEEVAVEEVVVGEEATEKDEASAIDDTISEITPDIILEEEFIDGEITEEEVNSLADRIHFLKRFKEGSDFILIESDGLYGLVDAGYRRSDTRDYSIQYLKDLGVETLEFVWISHYDEDHVTGLDVYTAGNVGYGGDAPVKRSDSSLLDNFVIKHVYLPENYSGAAYEASFIANITRTLDERGITYDFGSQNFEMGEFVMTTYNDTPFTEEEKSYYNGAVKANYSSRALLVCGERKL